VNARGVVAVVALGVTGWLGAVVLVLGEGEGEGEPVAVASTVGTAGSSEARTHKDRTSAAEHYAANVVARLASANPTAAAELLAGLPPTLDPAALRRIEADVVALATQLGQSPAASVGGLPASGLAAGRPVEVVLRDGSTLTLRVVCDGDCWLAGVQR
jgi:hypothetical protein